MHYPPIHIVMTPDPDVGPALNITLTRTYTYSSRLVSSPSHHSANANRNNDSKFGTPNPVTGSHDVVAFQLA